MANWPQADFSANQRSDSSETKGCLAKEARCDSWLLYDAHCPATKCHCSAQCSHAAPVPAYYIITGDQSRGLPPIGWAGVGHFTVRPFTQPRVHKAWCLAGKLVYNQTTRWRRCSYLVYKQNTRGQRCSYWKTSPYSPQRLIYGSCPRFAPQTVDAPINPVCHIGRKLQ